MDSTCIKQAVCKVLNKFQHGKYLVAYVLKPLYHANVFLPENICFLRLLHSIEENNMNPDQTASKGTLWSGPYIKVRMGNSNNIQY